MMALACGEKNVCSAVAPSQLHQLQAQADSLCSLRMSLCEGVCASWRQVKWPGASYDAHGAAGVKTP